tara:strand:- start:104 stop:529 length:426 start_codon:yes stop_codon:yes gene_type:complete
MTTPDKIKEKIKSLKQIWDSQTRSYISTYPDKKLGEPRLNEQSFNNMVKTYGKMISLDAQLHGISTGINDNLKMWDNKLVNLREAIGNNKTNLKNEYDTNIASGRLKTDKYNANSESYINASFYILAVSTITFFIYKQLKQ